MAARDSQHTIDPLQNPPLLSHSLHAPHLWWQNSMKLHHYRDKTVELKFIWKSPLPFIGTADCPYTATHLQWFSPNSNINSKSGISAAVTDRDCLCAFSRGLHCYGLKDWKYHLTNGLTLEVWDRLPIHTPWARVTRKVLEHLVVQESMNTRCSETRRRDPISNSGRSQWLNTGINKCDGTAGLNWLVYSPESNHSSCVSN